jgi:hypothetical protein
MICTIKKTAAFFFAVITVSSCSSLDCTTTETPTFTTLNTSIFSTTCATSGCHNATTQAGTYNMSTYAGVIAKVSGSNASASSLFTQVESGSMPQDGTELTDTQKCQISNWITAGAQNN